MQKRTVFYTILATFAGWLVSVVVIATIDISRAGYLEVAPKDIPLWTAIWGVIIALCVWATVLMPAAKFVKEGSVFWHPGIAPLLGAAWASGAVLVVLAGFCIFDQAPWTIRDWRQEFQEIARMPVLCAAVACLVFTLLVANRKKNAEPLSPAAAARG